MMQLDASYTQRGQGHTFVVCAGPSLLCLLARSNSISEKLSSTIAQNVIQLILQGHNSCLLGQAEPANSDLYAMRDIFSNVTMP